MGLRKSLASPVGVTAVGSTDATVAVDSTTPSQPKLRVVPSATATALGLGPLATVTPAGTKSSATVLYGDDTYRTPPASSGGGLNSVTSPDGSITPAGTSTDLQLTVTPGVFAPANLGGVWFVRRRPQLIGGSAGLTVGADQTTIINNAIANAQPYDTLKMPAGSWIHSGIITIATAKTDLTLIFYGADLVATVPTAAAFLIKGTRIAVRGMVHRVDWAGSTPTRGTGLNEQTCPIAASGATDLELTDCVSSGSRDTGYFMLGVTGLLVDNVETHDSMADGFHMTYGTSGVRAKGIRAINPGDDGIAVVSYLGDPTICSDIRVANPRVVNGQARGVSVVGGKKIRYSGVKVFRSKGSGIYVAQEQGPDFNSQPITDVKITDGDLYDANWDSTLDTGSIGVFNLASGTVMSDVLIAGITAQDRRGSTTGKPYGKVGNSAGGGGRLKGVTLQDINLEGGTAAPTFVVDGATSGTVAVGSFTYVTLTGTGTTATAEGATVSGSGSQIADASTTPSAPGVTFTRVRAGGRWASA